MTRFARACLPIAFARFFSIGAPAAAALTPAALTPAALSAAALGVASEARADTACPRDGEGARRAAPSAGYDRWLSGYAYPYPVKRFELSVQGSPACMAYMDVSPATANGHVVVLLHGKNFSGAYWKRTAEALLALGYRVILPDQIGFGKSSKPTDIQYSFDLLAQSTVRLLDSLGVAQASVVGHSMGGMLAARWAAQYPERTEKLVLVNPIGLEDYRRALPYLGVEGWQARATKQTPEAIHKYMQQSYFHGTWSAAYDELLQIQAGWAQGPDRELMARVSALTQDMIYTQPVANDLDAIRTPTLLVIGQEDRTAPGKSDVAPEVAAKLGNYRVLGERAARVIPGARLVRIEGVGHLPQFEAFDRYFEALSAFLPAASRAPARGAPRPDSPGK
jgi:pimeloyl-ACP methyl ester carboxylesterase